ncbi:MAG: hypothetical protein ACI3XG_00285 [Faecousia sp.]
MKKFIHAILHPFAPFVVFALQLIVNTILHNMEAFTLCAIVGVVFTVIMVISTIYNRSVYGKGVRIVAIVLCVLMVLCSVTDLAQLRSDVSQTSGTSTNTAATGGSYIPSNNISFGGGSGSTTSTIAPTVKVCSFCNGSKKCHVCSGKGDFPCSGLYCLSGKCTSCKGTGLYNHGSYVSRCLVCGGDGICNICSGTTRMDCTICSGTGKCTHCK